MRSIVLDYFANMFTSEVGEPDSAILVDVRRSVTQDMNTGLLAPFSYEALFQIGDLKAPGPDGLHAVFFKRFWSLLGDTLVSEVLDAVNNCKILDGWNDTTVILIPKVNNPTMVSQFHPISLCNVVYKVISKMLARGILPDIISDHQSAFVPRRLISDNILIAYESIHRIKKKCGKRGLCAIKLDMHKAYDRVEWSFLEKIMIKMGVHRRWVQLIMPCVSSDSMLGSIRWRRWCSPLHVVYARVTLCAPTYSCLLLKECQARSKELNQGENQEFEYVGMHPRYHTYFLQTTR